MKRTENRTAPATSASTRVADIEAFWNERDAQHLNPRPIHPAQLRLETDAAYAMRARQAREAGAWETARAAA